MPATAQIPNHVQVLVIGGGPAGSYAASCLVRENLQVCILEADKFPRYHIGESMMAALRHYLRYIDLEKGFEEHGFNRKVGAAFKLNRQNREGYTDFVSHDKRNYSWNLLREEADNLMLRHAEKSGALVFEETKVKEVEFDDNGAKSRPIAATWSTKNGATGRITFDWLVDASGRAGIVSTKNLHNRKFNQSLKNIAFWGYWKGAGKYSATTSRAGSPYFEALTDESGWAWFIPLHNGRTSVGIVMNQELSNQKKAKMPKDNNSLTAFYHDQLKLAPDIIDLIGSGTVDDSPDYPIRSASDYSYSASSYAGPHYRLTGDAAAFIDPFFSSGVHLAITSGLSAAASICASIRGDCTEEEAHHWHTTKVGTSYTRFLVVVLAAYRQMHAQNHPVLSDVDERDFDRAFEHFRPIIQGHSDVATNDYSEELRKTLDFCANAFEPSEPEPSANGSGEAAAAPKEKIVDKELAGLDKDSKRVFESLQSRGSMNNSDFEHIDNLLSDKFEGYRLRLNRGNLGLEKI